MAIKERLFNFFMLLLLVALPLSKGVASVAMVVLLLLSFVRFDFAGFKANLRKYPHIAALGLLLFAYVIGLTYSEDMAAGYEMVMKAIRYLLFPVIILANQALIKRNTLKYLTWFLVGLTGASLLVTGLLLFPERTVFQLTQDFPFLRDYPLSDDRLRYGLYSPFIDRIQFSSLLGIGLVCSLYLTMKTGRKYLYAGIAVLLTVTSLLLGGRGGQIGLFGGLCVFIIGNLSIYLYPKIRDRIGKTTAIFSFIGLLFLLLVVAPLGVYKFLPSVTKRYNQMFLELKTFAKDKNHQANYEHNTTVRRIVSWQNHWEVIKQHPVLGVGTGHYEQALAGAYNTDAYNLPVNAHSQYLQIWVTIGLWGLLLFLGIIFYWLKILAGPTQEYILALAFMAHYTISFLPDALLLTQIDSMAFSLFFCLFGLFKEKVSADAVLVNA